jgi:hypothetical protein
MRPQLNLALDDHPDLPEKLRKFCKLKGYKLSEYCARVLSEQCDREIRELSAPPDENQPASNLAEVQNTVSKLAEELEALGRAYNIDIPTIKNSIWLLQQSAKLPPPPQPNYEQVRDRILAKWKVAKRSESKERIAIALDMFIQALREPEI